LTSLYLGFKELTFGLKAMAEFSILILIFRFFHFWKNYAFKMLKHGQKSLVLMLWTKL